MVPIWLIWPSLPIVVNRHFLAEVDFEHYCVRRDLFEASRRICEWNGSIHAARKREKREFREWVLGEIESR